MDRRQRKTREAIFAALTDLLSRKDFSRITVGEIIEKADVGRATFYAHFETRDDLLRELCADLFCHIFDAAQGDETGHRHLFSCEAPDSVFLHLLQHLQKNDHHILDLLSGRNNELFLGYFKTNLRQLAASQLPLFAARKDERLPESFWVDHIASLRKRSAGGWSNACGHRRRPWRSIFSSLCKEWPEEGERDLSANRFSCRMKPLKWGGGSIWQAY